MNDYDDPKPQTKPRPGRGKWVVLVCLAALAAFLYVSIMVKISKFGF